MHRRATPGPHFILGQARPTGACRSTQTLGGFEECFGNPVTDPVVRRMGKLGLFHLRRWVPCEGFRLRRCLRTPPRAARPASLAVSASQSACDRPQVKFAAGTAQTLPSFMVAETVGFGQPKEVW